MEIEIWKDIPGYEGSYQASSFGRIKSLKRTVNDNGGKRVLKDRVLKPKIDKGYFRVSLFKNGIAKMKSIHQLIAIVFHSHIPNGQKTVVDHKDFDKLNNKADNLRIITNRENTNKKHLKSSSKYIGVSWSKARKKWVSNIEINNINKYLGIFDDEIKASQAYQEALLLHNKGEDVQSVINKNKPKRSSEYKGVCWNTECKKWKAQIFINGKNKHLGLFNNEYDAHLAYQKALTEFKQLATA